MLDRLRRLVRPRKHEPPQPAEPAEFYVTAEMFGDDWPFTVRDGTIRCEWSEIGKMITFETGGTVYGLNGTALTKLGVAYPFELQALDDDPEKAALDIKKSLAPINERAEELCD